MRAEAVLQKRDVPARQFLTQMASPASGSCDTQPCRTAKPSRLSGQEEQPMDVQVRFAMKHCVCGASQYRASSSMAARMSLVCGRMAFSSTGW